MQRVNNFLEHLLRAGTVVGFSALPDGLSIATPDDQLMPFESERTEHGMHRETEVQGTEGKSKEVKKNLTIWTILILPDMHPKCKGVLSSKSLELTSSPGLCAVSNKRWTLSSSFVLHAS